MGRMIFDLTDEDRAQLERLRVAMGLRSHAETLRALIRGGAPGAPVHLAAKAGPAPRAAPKTAAAAPKLDVPLAGTFERKPYQKGQKK